MQGTYPLHVEDILREIDAALERRGISARAASIRAQGAPEMIRDMRRGHVPSVERLRSLCEVLGLEFYVGPPRWRRAEDGGALPDIPLRALERSAQDLVRLTLDAGGNPISDDLWPALVARVANEPPVAWEPATPEERLIAAMERSREMRAGGAGIIDEDPMNLVPRGPEYRDRRKAHVIEPGKLSIRAIGDESAEPTPPKETEALLGSKKTASSRFSQKGERTEG